jgi:hypothetical protein
MSSVSITPLGRIKPFRSICPEERRAFRQYFHSQRCANSPLAVSLSGTGTTTLTITAQPENKRQVGQSANFSCGNGNRDSAYQWKRNGTAINGATGASYATPATTNADNGAQFAVVVTDGSQSVTSNDS